MFKRLWLPATLLVALIGCGAASQLAARTTEGGNSGQILSYASDIAVKTNGTLLIRETIKILTAGSPSGRNICRDIPTRYYDRFGNFYRIHFEVLGLERDEQPESFYLEKFPEGLRICLGQTREIIPSGEHTYELTYAVDRAIGFFPSHDELYWNVTGHGWVFPIQEVSAVVHLPKGIVRQALIPDAYTGGQGSAETDFTATADDQSNATFRTTRALQPHESLTLVVRWPKGFVRLPTEEQQHHYFLEDHQAGMAGLVGLGVVLIYFVGAWLLAGGSVEPDAESASRLPRGFSPAALRCLWRTAFDQKTLIVSLVDLAVKKELAILEDPFGGYILGRRKPSSQIASAATVSPSSFRFDLTPDEKLVLDELFAKDATVRVEPASPALGLAAEALYHHLSVRLEKFQFRATGRYLWPAMLISLLTLARCGFSVQGAHKLPVLVLTGTLLLCGLVCLAGVHLTVGAWRYARSDPYQTPQASKRAWRLTVFLILLLLFELAGFEVVAWAASADVVLVLAAFVTVHCLFHHLLRPRAQLTRELADQIEALRALLTPRPGRSDSPGRARDHALFTENYLPYAMALNVETGWGEQFAATLIQAHRASTYSPTWYSGPGWIVGTAANFATWLSQSFAGAMSSAKPVPHSQPEGVEPSDAAKAEP
jgi:hypothetical protein